MPIEISESGEINRVTENPELGKTEIGEIPIPENPKLLNNELKLNNNIYSLVIEKLNNLANTSYRSTTKKTKSLIRARVEEGFTLEDFYKVIGNKVTEWQGTEYEKYLRPETLFGTKFENYLNQRVKPKQDKTTKEDIDFYPNIDFETI